MSEMINVEEARAYALKRWPSPVVRRPMEALLDDCPRAEVESVRHGRWVKDDLYNTVCSVCGERIPCIEEYDTDDDCGGTYDVEIDETPYCPNCGAKMDGGEEDAK